MNLRKDFMVLAVAGALALSFSACKSKISDADLKAKVETVTSTHPGVAVDVKEGVITLSGTVGSEAEKTALAETIKALDAKHTKNLVNDVIVETAPPITVNTVDADLIPKVVDATKDFPSVKAEVKDGVITVTGTLEQARVQTLKMALDALNPKKVDMVGLTVK
ncbi:BON domain-containing protein [Sphingobacterium psychroaquaticum]|uniref:BON domain-containing protein n=1 Tax=Sphingobacterium psychroaquaticum TaxID=561061 RepID=A0A1X7JJ65_9SPHI|nr:BON domain-containing protein [Sphingobacterium psychroaquaticum]QBQ40741.1 BON domain-containing protein [Sphingobacterium psychroaquaticum]SMG28118.1 BON domain-containing protein [Sphingobacterium psychroaquaticum]